MSVTDICHIFDFARSHKWDEVFVKLNDKNINCRDMYGNYLLTYAVRFNSVDVVKKLLHYPTAKSDITDKFGRSILYDAIESNYFDIAKIILIHSQKSCGMFVVDIRDQLNGNIPLHYAINNKNIKLVELLLEFGSNTSIADACGNTSLHLAVKSWQLNIAKEIGLRMLSSLDVKNNDGETALHIAINHKYNDITIYLLSIGCDPTLPGTNNLFYPIHYAVGWNNIEILKHLVEKYNVDVNVQDIYGNCPIVYAIQENFQQCFDYMINLSQININLWNYVGKLPIHVALEIFANDHHENAKYYIDKLVIESDVSFQNNSGISPLYYIAEYNLWIEYSQYLQTKRLNIFAQNTKTKLYVFDVVAKHQFKDFLNLVVDSYLYALKSTNDMHWENEIDALCSKNWEQLTPKEKKLIKGNDVTSNCKAIILSKLNKQIDDAKKRKITFCQRSYPFNNSACIYNCDNCRLHGTEFCTFTGTILDIFIGLLFLLKKYRKKICVPMKIDANFDKTICGKYKSQHLIATNRCELYNFELVWIGHTISNSCGFIDKFKLCYDSCCDFIIIPLGIELQCRFHANYLILDKHSNELERFEPHGTSLTNEFNYNPKLLDASLAKFFSTINSDITYISPADYLPHIGFQIIEEHEHHAQKIGDPIGFCALWCIWYADQRIYNSQKIKTGKQLVPILLSSIKEQNISFKNVIRNYSRNIVDIRDKLLKKANMTINDWLNDNYTQTQMNNFISHIKNEYDAILLQC